MLLVSSCKRMSAQEVGVNKVVHFSLMLLYVHRDHKGCYYYVVSAAEPRTATSRRLSHSSSVSCGTMWNNPQ